MNKNQNDLATKINSYKADTIVKLFFREPDRKDIGAREEENKKLESILGAVDNSKTNDSDDNQVSLTEGYTLTEKISNKEEKPGLLTRISNKFSSPWVKYPYINGVPYVEQPTDKLWCLPASGAMVFNHYGTNVTQQQVADKVIKENGTGSPKKLREYAKELGFKAEVRNLTLEWVKKVLQQDVPIIMVQDFSLINPNDHARVVIGYDDKKQELITHDPSPVNGKNYTISYSEAIALNNINPPFFCSNMIYPKDVNLNLP